jgi:hypothetical protein
MSTLKVNAITNVAGKPLVNSTGSILQVVNTNTVGQSGEIITSSATYVTTGLSVTITPLSATSKLFVQFSGNNKFYGQGGNPGDDGIALKIYRDGSPINATGGGDNLYYRSDSGFQNNHSNVTINHYVNANSVSPTTFTLYFTDQWGGYAYITKDWGCNQFTVWEISG